MNGYWTLYSLTYTKTNSQTGKSYAVKLCNPVDGSKASYEQKTQRTKFGIISSAVAAWISTEKATNSGAGSVQYLSALAAALGTTSCVAAMQ